MSYRLRNFIIATVLALLAGLLTTAYVSNYKHRVQRGEHLARVLVATRTIRPGTSAASLRGSVAVRKVQRRTLVSGAVSDPKQLQGLVATQPIFAGEQITARRFSTLGAVGPRGVLHGHQRLFALPGNANQLLAGTLKAGDRVDVIAALPSSSSTSVKPTQILLRDVLVVQPASKPQDASTSSEPALSALLALADTDAQKLFFATENGEWTLALRPIDGSAK